MSGSYIILRDTWIYQDIKQEAQKEIQQSLCRTATTYAFSNRSGAFSTH